MTPPVEPLADALPGAECTLDHCITCSDEAVPMRVVALDAERGLALCETADGDRSSVETALVDAGLDDEVLVHAGVALHRVGAAA